MLEKTETYFSAIITMLVFVNLEMNVDFNTFTRNVQRKFAEIEVVDIDILKHASMEKIVNF